MWTPQGYSPDDGKSYNVLFLLHGLPGSADNVITDIKLDTEVQEAISSGELPPTIIVAPDLNADPKQTDDPDCADFASKAKVGTWLQVDVPELIRTDFSNVRSDRDGWALAGISAGAYCAVWTTIERSDEFASTIDLSGYDIPMIGSLADSTLASANTLTTLLTSHPHQSIGLWVVGAADDFYSADAMAALKEVAKRDTSDDVDATLLTSGGHNNKVWTAAVPDFLSWWGKRPGVAGPR